VQIRQWKAAMSRQQPVRKKQRTRRVRHDSHRELPRSANPFMRQIVIQEVGEVRWRDGRRKARAVVSKRLVVVPREKTDRLRTLEDQLEDPQQGFQTVAAVIKEIAEENDPRGLAILTLALTTNQSECRIECKEVTVNVPDEPERLVGKLYQSQRPISAALPLVIEQHSHSALRVKQSLELLDRRSHARTQGAGSQRRSDPFPIEIANVNGW
jgi:hypothetical protein